MITTNINNIFYQVLNTKPLTDLIGGEVFNGNRPLDRNEEDITIIAISVSTSRPQTGETEIHVHVPDTKIVSGGIAQQTANTAKLDELSKAVEQVLSEAVITGLAFKVDSKSTLETAIDHFVSLRLSWVAALEEPEISRNYYTKDEIDEKLEKINIKVDDEVLEDSINAVKSKGIYAFVTSEDEAVVEAFQKKQALTDKAISEVKSEVKAIKSETDKIPGIERDIADLKSKEVIIDSLVSETSENAVKSSGIYEFCKNIESGLTDAIDKTSKDISRVSLVASSAVLTAERAENNSTTALADSKTALADSKEAKEKVAEAVEAAESVKKTASDALSAAESASQTSKNAESIANDCSKNVSGLDNRLKTAENDIEDLKKKEVDLDDSVTETSSNGVKSSGIYSFIQPTKAQVEQNKTDIAESAKTIGILSKEIEANTADIESLKNRKTAEWGNIGGEISAQTDLQSALDAKQDSIAGSGAGSTALGVGTIASAPYQIALGRYNVEDTEGRFALIVGNGTSADNRSNAFAVTWDGEIVSDDMSSLVRNLGGVTGISAVSDVPETQENGVLYVITAQ